MTTYAGFQKQGYFNVQQAKPGDLLSNKASTTLAANGYFAKSALVVGGGAFIASNGNQVAANSSDAGSTMPAGVLLGNQGGSYMSWADSDVGYTMNIPVGSQPTFMTAGDAGALLTGVDSSGVANHTPVVGDNIWQNNTTSAFVAVASSVSSVTGYTRLGSFRVTKAGLTSQTTVSTNQAICRISGSL